MKNFSTKTLTLTVGITTCYGDVSILETVKSLRASAGVGKFDFIIVADRVPISKEIKRSLKKYDVRLVENSIARGQMEKQKQILARASSDIVVFTQDDVLFASNTLASVLKRFEQNPEVTMISIPYEPIKSGNFFENIIDVGTNIANRIAKYWNEGDNYLSSIGRFMAFRREMLKKFRMPKIAASDNYYYFEDKKMGGKFEYVSDVAVYFKNPQNMREHLRKSSRFQHSQLEMSEYFSDLSKEYSVPKNIILRVMVEEFMRNPFYVLLYMLVFAYTRLLKLNPKSVLNPVWQVDLSTKKLKA